MLKHLRESRPKKWLFAAVLLPVLLSLLASGWPPTEAYAASGGSTIDASCSQMQNWGFTAGIVYCVQKSINNAVLQYVTAMQGALRYYEGMMCCVAIIVFAFKLMNQAVEDPRKEMMQFAFRVFIGVFCYENAGNFYNWIAGTLPGNNGIINEAISWVTGVGASGSASGNMFSSIISSNCTVDNPPQAFGGYQVWQAFDCMFREILGAASPTAHPYAFSTSLLVVVAASLFSATSGVMVAAFGLQMFLGALLLVFRALYLVLMAYVCIGFMCLFAPLIAPMFFFESDFLQEKFKRWVGVIISCIFQPVLVIGFLAMAICIDDQFIEGNLPAPGCTLPIYPNTSGNSSPDPIPGSGVCSFTQLFNQGFSGDPNASLQTAFHNLIDNNATMFTQMAGGDPQNRNTNVSPSSTSNAGYIDTANMAASGNTGTIPLDGLVNQNAAQFQWAGATRLKKWAPTQQLFLTLLAFIFVNYAMYHLLQILPDIAARLSTYTVHLMNPNIKMPFEDGLGKALGGAKSKALQAAGGQGVVPQAGRAASSRSAGAALPTQRTTPK